MFFISKPVQEVHEENKQACPASMGQAPAIMYKPSRLLHWKLLSQPTTAKPSCRRHVAMLWLRVNFYKTTERNDYTPLFRNPEDGGNCDFGEGRQRFRVAINDKHKPALQRCQTEMQNGHDDGIGQCSMKALPTPP